MCVCMCIRYIKERGLAYAREDPHAGQGPAELGTLLWQILAVQVKQGVTLKGLQHSARPQVCMHGSCHMHLNTHATLIRPLHTHTLFK